jgi:hypothetical protein
MVGGNECCYPAMAWRDAQSRRRLSPVCSLNLRRYGATSYIYRLPQRTPLTHIDAP